METFVSTAVLPIRLICCSGCLRQQHPHTNRKRKKRKRTRPSQRSPPHLARRVARSPPASLDPHRHRHPPPPARSPSNLHWPTEKVSARSPPLTPFPPPRLESGTGSGPSSPSPFSPPHGTPYSGPFNSFAPTCVARVPPPPDADAAAAAAAAAAAGMSMRSRSGVEVVASRGCARLVIPGMHHNPSSAASVSSSSSAASRGAAAGGGAGAAAAAARADGPFAGLVICVTGLSKGARVNCL